MANRRIEYRRTVSFGSFANETVGLTRDLHDDENTQEAFAAVVQFVEGELAKLAAARDAKEIEEEKLRRAERDAIWANAAMKTGTISMGEPVPRSPGDNALIRGPAMPRWGDGEDAPVGEVSDGPF